MATTATKAAWATGATVIIITIITTRRGQRHCHAPVATVTPAHTTSTEASMRRLGSLLNMKNSMTTRTGEMATFMICVCGGVGGWWRGETLGSGRGWSGGVGCGTGVQRSGGVEGKTD